MPAMPLTEVYRSCLIVYADAADASVAERSSSSGTFTDSAMAFVASSTSVWTAVLSQAPPARSLRLCWKPSRLASSLSPAKSLM
eukprot:CAMPEP_0115832916 /NCGR_PEP_ID=MMETSP0287-20121206/2904_1 /TAXON_ID=412157 /ORGANISM="Chrysochromulina rotalis, Strain UIO044" /LENGTH=83 /DNA_ID=CAMNT_0003286315 /DNA_START=903 /DNA_END=1154 /DNA_ORIENTATION=-